MAGVIPFRGDTVLLGKDKHIFWSGFGGKQEFMEELTYTAYREFMEESCGMFSLNYPDFLRRISPGHLTHTPSGKPFMQFALDIEKVPYDDFCTCKSKLPCLPHFMEKTIVQWFPRKALPRMKPMFLKEVLFFFDHYIPTDRTDD